jgi:hypothetical protein
MAHKKDFVGAWALEEFTVAQSNRQQTMPFGDEPTGNLIYTESGCMSATFMSSRRPLLGASRPQLPTKTVATIKEIKKGAPTPDFAKAYFLSGISFTGYTGTFSIDNNTVRHHVEACLIQDWVGTDLVRSYTFENDLLILTAIDGGLTDRLVWKKVF